MNDTPNLIGLRQACIEKKAAVLKGVTRMLGGAGLRSLLSNAAKSFKKGWARGSGSLTSNIPDSVIPKDVLKDAKKVHIGTLNPRPRPVSVSHAVSYNAQDMLRANAKANPHWTRERHLESMRNMGYSPSEYNIDELFVPSTKTQPKQLIELTY